VIDETSFVFRLKDRSPRKVPAGSRDEWTYDDVAKLHQQMLVVPASALRYGRVDQTRAQKPVCCAERNDHAMTLKPAADPTAPQRPAQQLYARGDADVPHAVIREIQKVPVGQR